MKLRPASTPALRFDPPRLLAAQMELVDRNLTTALLSSGGVACITALAYQATLGDRRIWWWALCTILLLMGGLLWRAAQPSPAAAAFNPLRHAQGLRVIWALNGSAWGALALLFLRPGEPDSTNLIAVMIAGMSSAGPAVFGPPWPTALTYRGTAHGPCALPPL